MTGNLPLILIAALAIIALLCVAATIVDLARGTSRMAHETHDSARAQLPLNFWVGVGAKAIGAIAAVGLAMAVWQSSV